MKKPRKTPLTLREDPERVLMHSLYAMEGQNPSRAIEDQERRGQQSVQHKDVLPNRLSQRDRDTLTGWGFQIGEVLPDDDMFLEATLPDGWRKASTGHSMYTNLLDPQGRKRGSIGYKAAHYDRWVSFYLCCRYVMNLHHPTGEYEFGKSIYGVVDTAEDDKFLYIPTPEAIKAHAQEGYVLNRGDEEACVSWLNEHFPDWKNPAAYWD